MDDPKTIVSDPKFQKIGQNSESIIIIHGNSNNLATEFFAYGLNFKKSAHIIME